FGHWKTTTFVAALRRNGLGAPMVLDGPMTGQAFLAHVEQVLIPTLTPGDIVALDAQDHRRARRNRGRRRAALPVAALWPDMNPIEMVFAKLKTLLRQASERAREGPWNRIGDLLDRFTGTNASISSGPLAMPTHSENALERSRITAGR